MDTLALLEAAEVGSVFTKQSNGWRMEYIRNGTTLSCSGPTIPDALATYGLHRTHDSVGNEHGQPVTSGIIGEPIA